MVTQHRWPTLFWAPECELCSHQMSLPNADTLSDGQQFRLIRLTDITRPPAPRSDLVLHIERRAFSVNDGMEYVVPFFAGLTRREQRLVLVNGKADTVHVDTYDFLTRSVTDSWMYLRCLCGSSRHGPGGAMPQTLHNLIYQNAALTILWLGGTSGTVAAHRSSSKAEILDMDYRTEKRSVCNASEHDIERSWLGDRKKNKKILVRSVLHDKYWSSAYALQEVLHSSRFVVVHKDHYFTLDFLAEHAASGGPAWRILQWYKEGRSHAPFWMVLSTFHMQSCCCYHHQMLALLVMTACHIPADREISRFEMYLHSLAAYLTSGTGHSEALIRCIATRINIWNRVVYVGTRTVFRRLAPERWQDAEAKLLLSGIVYRDGRKRGMSLPWFLFRKSVCKFLSRHGIYKAEMAKRRQRIELARLEKSLYGDPLERWHRVKEKTIDEWEEVAERICDEALDWQKAHSEASSIASKTCKDCPSLLTVNSIPVSS